MTVAQRIKMAQIGDQQSSPKYKKTSRIGVNSAETGKIWINADVNRLK